MGKSKKKMVNVCLLIAVMTAVSVLLTLNYVCTSNITKGKTNDKNVAAKKPAHYTVVKFDPDKNHMAVVGGIEKSAEKNVVQKFCNNFSGKKHFKIVNKRLPDAEKFSLVWQTSSVQTEQILKTSPSEIKNEKAALKFIAKGLGDTELCWAESCSDMLMIAGWAQNVKSPYTKQKFTSVDKVSDYYTKNFVDKSGTAYAGVDYFITGKVNYPDLMMAVVKVKAKSKAMFPKVATENVAHYYDWFLEDNEFRESEFISTLKKYIDQGGSVGFDLATIMEDGVGKHAMTIAGYVLDKKTGKITHLVIINSDDNALDYKNSKCTKYDTLKDAKKNPALRKENRPNVFNVYPVKYQKYKKKKYLSLVGYSKNKNEKTIISDITVLEQYQDRDSGDSKTAIRKFTSQTDFDQMWTVKSLYCN